MKGEIKALCTDVDGTLLDSRKELSVRTIDTIRKVSASMPVMLASSRMPAAMRHLQAQLGILDHPLVCYNGGYVIQYQAKDQVTVFESITIPVEVCSAILDMSKNTDVHVSLYHADEWYAPRMDQWTEREEKITKAKSVVREGRVVLDEWASTDKGAHKVMCMGPAEEIAILEKQLRESLAQAIHVYHSRSTYLELAPKQISKATGVDLAMKKVYSMSIKDVMAFGDNYNDIEMIREAGFGVAVANARDEAKAVADYITGKSVDDGVAEAIERFLY